LLPEEAREDAVKRVTLGGALAAAFAAGAGLALLATGQVELPRAFAATGNCSDLTRGCVVEVARTYIDSISDKSVRVRYAQHFRRYENGVLHYDGAPEAPPDSKEGLNQFRRDFPQIYNETFPMLAGRDKERVWVEGKDAIFRWILDQKDPKTGEAKRTTHLFERVHVEQGVACAYGMPSPCITEVELVFCTAPHPNETAFPAAQTPKPDLSCDRKG
jgi:hypothetical protein